MQTTQQPRLTPSSVFRSSNLGQLARPLGMAAFCRGLSNLMAKGSFYNKKQALLWGAISYGRSFRTDMKRPLSRP